jgi:hypothetical protein
MSPGVEAKYEQGPEVKLTRRAADKLLNWKQHRQAYTVVLGIFYVFAPHSRRNMSQNTSREADQRNCAGVKTARIWKFLD